MQFSLLVLIPSANINVVALLFALFALNAGDAVPGFAIVINCVVLASLAQASAISKWALFHFCHDLLLVIKCLFNLLVICLMKHYFSNLFVENPHFYKEICCAKVLIKLTPQSAPGSARQRQPECRETSEG